MEINPLIKMNLPGYKISNRTDYIKFIDQFLFEFSKWHKAQTELSVGQEIEETFALKEYQILVSNYLQEKTPYRGLLLYHGLGSGKTASAITVRKDF